MRRTISCNIILSLAMACTLIACRNKGKGVQTVSDVKEITFNEAPNDYMLAKQFKRTRMVQLEYTDDCFIGEIKKVVSTEGMLFILTRNDEIFCFNETTGKFIKRIGNIGEGPGEYLKATSIFLNEKEKTISVVDDVKSVILVYSIDGKYIEKKQVEMPLAWADCAEMSKDGTLMISTRITGGRPANEYAYITMNPKGKVSYLDPFAPVKVENFAMSVSNHPMTICDEGIRFFKYLNDTIFTLKEGKVEPYLRLNLGREMPPKDIVAKMGEDPDMSVVNLYSSGYITRLDKIYETDKFIVAIPYFETTTGYYWIDKDKQRGMHIISSNEVDKESTWFLQGRSIIRIVGAERNRIISSFSEMGIYSVKNVLEKNKELNLFNDSLKDFFEHANPDGNPCLVFYEN